MYLYRTDLWRGVPADGLFGSMENWAGTRCCACAEAGVEFVVGRLALWLSTLDFAA